MRTALENVVVTTQKDSLVMRIKQFQNLGPEHKELWCAYCDTYLGGTRDPARHDEATLNEFCVNHGVPELSGGAPGMVPPASAQMGGCAGVGAMGMDPMMQQQSMMQGVDMGCMGGCMGAGMPMAGCGMMG